jgi:hypothetical protein
VEKLQLGKIYHEAALHELTTFFILFFYFFGFVVVFQLLAGKPESDSYLLTATTRVISSHEVCSKSLLPEALPGTGSSSTKRLCPIFYRREASRCSMLIKNTHYARGR